MKKVDEALKRIRKAINDERRKLNVTEDLELIDGLLAEAANRWRKLQARGESDV